MLNRKTLLIAALTALALVAIFMFATNGSAHVSASVVNPPAVEHQAQAPASSAVRVVGTFIAPTQAVLVFKGSGRITDIKVQEGAKVKKGDTLAVLDTTELQLSVQATQAALAGAQARLAQTQTPATDADTAAAQAAVDAALKNYQKVRAGPTALDVTPLKTAVDNAQAALGQVQAQYDRAGGSTNPFIGLSPLSVQLQQATNNYNAALAAYNNALTHPTPAELAAAWGQVQQAQDALSRLQPTAQNVAAAQAAVDQAQAALALSQAQVNDATLTAPFDGTVIWFGPHVGESAGPTTPILTLADLSHLQLQVGVDENSLALIQVGQPVVITPEAYKDKTVTGKVSRIGLLATTTAGVINLPVTIDVDPTDVPLRPGLSASADIGGQGQ